MLDQKADIEKELLNQLKNGDKNAFTSIYQSYAPALVGFVASKLSSREEARDIIHDIFTSLWDASEKLDVKTGTLQSFLFAAAHYRVIDHIRKHVTRKAYAEMLGQLSDMIIFENGEAEIVSKDLHNNMEQAVEKLPLRVKQIYRLSRDRHLAIREIAFKLGLSEQTVKNQLSTALHHLRTSWEKLTVLVISLRS